MMRILPDAMLPTAPETNTTMSNKTFATPYGHGKRLVFRVVNKELQLLAIVPAAELPKWNIVKYIETPDRADVNYNAVNREFIFYSDNFLALDEQDIFKAVRVALSVTGKLPSLHEPVNTAGTTT